MLKREPVSHARRNATNTLAPASARTTHAVGISVSLMLGFSCSTNPPEATPSPAEPASPVEPQAPQMQLFSSSLASLDRAPVEVPAQVDWLLFGGGSEPLSNQVSLAQDLGFVRELVAGPGITLFASGPDSPLAVEARKPPHTTPLLRELSRMFGVPGSELTHYEAASLPVDGPSTADQVLHVLERALVQSREPLFVYAASHGERGARAADNSLALWGGWPLKVSDLTSLLDRHADAARPTRFVVTACFGGGFADLAFVGADPKQGLRNPDHCGVFAAPWDEEASGCDPNPDRRDQESYSIHFLHALTGKDRQGIPRPRDIDLNGDAQVSLLEAHTYARIRSRSFDNPTTTSERFLREVAGKGKAVPLDPLAAPEEVAVIRALGEELGLSKAEEAQTKLDALSRILGTASSEVEQAQKQADDAYYALRIAVLERFPLLEHPWDPRTQALLAQHGPQIHSLLSDSDLAQAQSHAASELEQAALDQDAARVERARVLRLSRAFETLRLASALKHKGGPHFSHYEALRRCENWVPRLRTGGTR